MAVDVSKRTVYSESIYPRGQMRTDLVCECGKMESRSLIKIGTESVECRKWYLDEIVTNTARYIAKLSPRSKPIQF
jgi:hypothetical protein